MNNVKIAAFDCDKDLSKYTDSLLFCSDEVIAAMTIEDEKGNSVDMELIVTGDVNVNFNGENYTSPDEFPPELKQAIKNGEYDKTFVAESNNWFELVYSLTDANDAEVAYDGDVWESNLSTMTVEEVKEIMFDCGISFMEHYGKELSLNKTSDEIEM